MKNQSVRSLLPLLLVSTLSACGPEAEVPAEAAVPAEEASVGANTAPLATFMVNGYSLTANEDSWIRWIAAVTVPALQGDRETRLTIASRVAWWSLKEGVLALNSPLPYSNCAGVGHIGPVTDCGSSIWQVGIAGIQVHNATLTQAVNTAKSLYPAKSEAQFLGETANMAGFATGTATYNAIVNSTGNLRKSWFERHHAVGFILQEPIVTRECIVNRGCNSAAWQPSAKYAPTFTASERARSEIRAILASLAP
ncbi:MAG TPA: hypothetical protein VEU33_17005 [Archangium sp.]|nr:hypothetical protein [Archangium sp.]